MAIVLVYNDIRRRMERYRLNENDPMPYSSGNNMSVHDFRGRSTGEYLWTDRRAMDSWNKQVALWGRPIYIGEAFKRPFEGGFEHFSQHYAGVAFDIGQNLSVSEIDALNTSCRNSGLWVYVSRQTNPDAVHVDKRSGPASCAAVPYPLLRRGAVNQYVCILQDCINVVGYRLALDGVFGRNTESGVKAYQRTRGLQQDGIVGCNTWYALMTHVVAGGRTVTTLP